MDVFDAVSSRIACRYFLDQHVDPDIVHRLVEGAANAASSSNLQPWNVYAVTGEPLNEIKRQAVDAIEKRDWRTLETDRPECRTGVAEYSASLTAQRSVNMMLKARRQRALQTKTSGLFS
jgi:nitroreductase